MYGLWDTLVSLLGAGLGWNGPPRPHARGGILSADAEMELDRMREKWNINGMSIAIVSSPDDPHGNGDWREHIVTFGTSDGESKGVSADTIWSTPSTSKFITTLALTNLIDAKTTLPNGELLGWETRFSSIFPHWDVVPDDFENSEYGTCDLTLLELGNERGSARGRDSAFRMISMIVEHLSGMPFVEYAHKYILEPMNLDYTMPADLDFEQTRHFADGFIREGIDYTQCAKESRADKSILHHSCLGTPRKVGWWSDRMDRWQEDGDEWYFGAASVALDSNQMTTVLHSVLDKDSRIHHLVSLEPSYERSRNGIRGMGAAFGRYYEHDYDHMSIYHAGAQSGQSTLMVWVPDMGVGLYVAMNDQFHNNDLLYAFGFTALEDLVPVDSARAIDREKLVVRAYTAFSEEYPSPPAISSAPKYGFEDVFEHSDLAKFRFRSIRPAGQNDHVVEHIEFDYIMRAITEQQAYALNIAEPMHIARIRASFHFNYLLLTHWDADRWNWTAINVYNVPTEEHEAQRGEWQRLLKTGEIEQPVVDILGTGGAEVTGEGIRMYQTWWDVCAEKNGDGTDGPETADGISSFIRRLPTVAL